MVSRFSDDGLFVCGGYQLWQNVRMHPDSSCTHKWARGVNNLTHNVYQLSKRFVYMLFYKLTVVNNILMITSIDILVLVCYLFLCTSNDVVFDLSVDEHFFFLLRNHWNYIYLLYIWLRHLWFKYDWQNGHFVWKIVLCQYLFELIFK